MSYEKLYMLDRACTVSKHFALPLEDCRALVDERTDQDTRS